MSTEKTAGLLRRVAAGFYDSLLLIGVLVIPTLIAIALRGGESIPPGNLLYQFLLIATTAGFFIGFWMHGGQTLGMRAWRLRVTGITGEPITLRTGLKRFVASILALAPLGLGVLWMLIDSQNLSWADRLSDTRVIVVPKKKRR
jgi:uncharacterized RDD family membrane protein YckC